MVAESVMDGGGVGVKECLTLRKGLTLDEAEQRIGVAFAGAGLRHRVASFYLADIDARGLHQLAGFRSAAQWAEARFGMSRREARQLLAAGRVLADLPRIDDAFAEGRLCWSKVRELVRVVTPEHEERWLKVALESRIADLALEVRLSKRGDPPRDRDDRKGLPAVRVRLNTLLPADVYAKWEQAHKKMRAGSDRPLEEWESVDAMLDVVLSDQSQPDASSYTVVVHPDTCCVETDDGELPIGENTARMLLCEAEHNVPRWLRRKVLARDGFRCRCCGCRHRLHTHHIIWFSLGGKTVMINLITLCRSCHAKVHAELMVIVGDADDCCFQDREGRDLHGPPPEPRRFLADPEADPDPGTPRRLLGAMAAPQEPVKKAAQCAARLSDLVGQRNVIESLQVAIDAARRLGEPLGHTLLTGPPGLGKTTIAFAAANELGATVHATAGPLLSDPGRLLRAVESLKPGDVLFIDEIHAMPQPVCEVLYESLQPGSEMPKFTLIGATTDEGLLHGAFLSRFENHLHLEFYSPPELAEVIRRSNQRRGLEIEPRAAAELAEVSRHSPREALRLLRQVRNAALALGRPRLDMAVVALTMDRLGVDGRGLRPIDREYLRILRQRGPDRPLGLARAATILGVSPTTLERVYEPYLIRLGLIDVTPGGRVAQCAATSHRIDG